MLKEFNNLDDFEEAFPNEEAAVLHFAAIRWPSGVACVHCGSAKVYKFKKPGTYKCGEKECAEKFTVRNGTIFEDSKLAIRKWLKAIFLMTSHKKGISSCQLARDLGITQKTAWFVLHRIRNAAETNQFRAPLMTGKVQADETFLGGKEKWKHASKRTRHAAGRGSMYSKVVVMGMISDTGELRLKKIPNFGRKDIEAIIKRNVRPGSTVHTDEATHYKWMHRMYEHGLVKHRFGEYVTKDGIHTNAIEGAFSHFKRAITGVYHKASDKHVERYLTMFGWRWSRKKMTEGERVNELLKATKGRRITYRQLTGKDE